MFNYEWCVMFITKEEFHVGDIKWFCPKVFDVSLFLKWFACIVKKKQKVFDLLGISSESEQDQKISSSIESFSLKFTACDYSSKS